MKPWESRGGPRLGGREEKRIRGRERPRLVRGDPTYRAAHPHSPYPPRSHKVKSAKASG